MEQLSNTKNEDKCVPKSFIDNGPERIFEQNDFRPKYTQRYYANSDNSSSSVPMRYYNYRFHNPKNLLALKKLIFPSIAYEKLSQLMIDDESIKYITFNSSAQEITNIIMNNLDDFPSPNSSEKDKWQNKSLDKKMKHLVITEMTAGVGGNVLNFAKYFKYVNAIEKNMTRYNYLNKNIRLYEYNNVNCYNNNSLDLLIKNDDLVQDIIFFDPPWGGKDYKLLTNLRLNFEEYTIEEVCKILLQRERNKMIVLKLPYNYDFNYFTEELKNYRVFKFVLERMTIIVVKNYTNENES